MVSRRTGTGVCRGVLTNEVELAIPELDNVPFATDTQPCGHTYFNDLCRPLSFWTRVGVSSPSLRDLGFVSAIDETHCTASVYKAGLRGASTRILHLALMLHIILLAVLLLRSAASYSDLTPHKLPILPASGSSTFKQANLKAIQHEILMIRTKYGLKTKSSLTKLPKATLKARSSTTSEESENEEVDGPVYQSKRMYGDSVL